MALSNQIDKANTLIDTCDKNIEEENKKESQFD